MSPAASAPARPRVLSGIQPTADSFHLGNYLGALQHWVSLQATHDAFYCIVDLHAITLDFDPVLLRERTLGSLAQLIAAGVDPGRSTMFVQSHVPEHAQLAWVMGCLTGFGEASRMTQFKDKSQRAGTDSTTVGLFTYPVLMAADILLYQADQVPVGEDQRQHLELTRNLAQRFNHRFGPTFTVPEPHIIRDTAKIYDLQVVDKQMSKSIGGSGCIWLLDDPAVSAKRIRSAVTDSGREVHFDPVSKPGISNLLTIHAALTGVGVAESEKEFGGGGYGELKKAVAAVVADFTAGFGQRYRAVREDPATLDDIAAAGAARAREVSAATLALAYDRVGFLPARRRD